MPQNITCFLVEPIERGEVYTRRYASQSNCVKHGYHNTLYLNEKIYLPFKYHEEGWILDGSGIIPNEEQKQQMPFPTHCSCSYKFQPEDMWQIQTDRLYKQPDTETTYTRRQLPAGAMYHADWGFQKGPDGHCLGVQTPAGPWLIDDGWTRTGTPPKITASPSIAIGKPGPNYYHAYLRDGVLVPCSDSTL